MKKIFLVLALTSMCAAVSATTLSSLNGKTIVFFKGDDEKKKSKKKKKEKACCKKDDKATATCTKGEGKKSCCKKEVDNKNTSEVTK